MAGEVEVIKAVEGNGTRRRNMIGSGLSIERMERNSCRVFNRKKHIIRRRFLKTKSG